jgi:hypothetical protein
MVVGKVVAHLCPTLIIKDLKFNVEHDKVVTTLNIIFSVACTHRKCPTPPQEPTTFFYVNA